LISNDKRGLLTREPGLHVDHAVAERLVAQPLGDRLPVRFAVSTISPVD
jgi:hypothetical protein